MRREATSRHVASQNQAAGKGVSQSEVTYPRARAEGASQTERGRARMARPRAKVQSKTEVRERVRKGGGIVVSQRKGGKEKVGNRHWKVSTHHNVNRGNFPKRCRDCAKSIRHSAGSAPR